MQGIFKCGRIQTTSLSAHNEVNVLIHRTRIPFLYNELQLQTVKFVAIPSIINLYLTQNRTWVEWSISKPMLKIMLMMLREHD